MSLTFEEVQHFVPTADRVIVHLRPGVQETPSGLIIPPDSQQITQYGDVLAVGPDQKLVSPGDLVLLNLHCGIHLCDHLNTPVLLVESTDIQAVLDRLSGA